MGYLILLLAVTIIAYPLFEKRMITRAKEMAKKEGRRRGSTSYKLRNRLYIVAVLIAWLVLASVAVLTNGTIWILLAIIATIACIGYILWVSYYSKDLDMICAMTYLITPFAAFVFCVIARAVGSLGGLIGGLIAAIVVVILPRVAFLQGYYDEMNGGE